MEGNAEVEASSPQTNLGDSGPEHGSGQRIQVSPSRNLGLFDVTMIGVGAMIGAGISGLTGKDLFAYLAFMWGGYHGSPIRLPEVSMRSSSVHFL